MRIFQGTYRDRRGKLKKSKTWRVRFTTSDGRDFDIPLKTRNRQAAGVKATELFKAAELRAVGIETHDATRRLSPTKLADEYERVLIRRGRAPRHITGTMARIRAALDGAADLRKVTRQTIQQLLDRLRDQGKAAATIRGYKIAIGGFFRWLIKQGRWTQNPVDAIETVQADPTYERRALTNDELDRLCAAAPTDRAIIYRTAAMTGFRRSELKALRVGDVDVDGSTIRLRAKDAKNRREAYQPIPGSLAALLRAHVRTRADDERLFDTIPRVERLREDLAAAREAWEAEKGISKTEREKRTKDKAFLLHIPVDGVVDLHSLRVTYATNLARAGVSLQEAQKLLRHGDPKLTMNVYTRLGIHDLHAAVDALDGPTRTERRARQSG